MRTVFFVSAAFLCAGAIATPTLAGPINDAAKNGDVGEIQRLLNAGADANETDPMASPLHWAAMKGHAGAVQLLAEHGATLDAQSDMLGTPLHAASRFGHVEAVGELIAAGADLDAPDRDKFTPLMRAVIETRPEAVEALLSAGADVDAVGDAPGGWEIGYGPTIALQLAIRYGRDDIAQLLTANGAGPIPPEVPANLLTQGDPERGQELAYTYCEECHSISADDPPRQSDILAGPPLIGLMGRPVADLPGYEYSDALISHGGVWTPERFYAFALRPTLTVPGTLMNWAPDRTPEMIADITAYFVMRDE